jgi:hypothetical protein
MRIPFVVAATLGVVLALSSASAAHAESTAYVGDGQKITGTVPVGEVIRLTIPLPSGATPRLNFSLKGSKVPVSFLRSDLYDPAGNLIPDTSRFFEGTRVRANRSTLRLRDFVAPTSGEYQLVIETNSDRLPGIIDLRASGKLKVERVTKFKERFSTAGAGFEFGLQARDQARAIVKRISGDIPDIAMWRNTQFSSPQPPQSATKKGGSTQFFKAGSDDAYAFQFGYRDSGSFGEYLAVVKIRPIRSPGGISALRLANAPGIPLSVRAIDRSITLNFGTGAPGLSYDGTYLLVSALDTSSGAAEIGVRFYDRDLFAQSGTPVPRPVVGPLDMQPGRSVGGHRMLFADNHHVVLWWTANGANAGMVRFSRDLLRRSSIEAIVGAPKPIVDPFLASDGTRISFGVAEIDFGHRVRVYESDFATVGTFDIGGGQYTHGNGAGVTWRPSNVQGQGNVFEFWAPDSTDPTQPSDLHRQTYSSLWQPQSPDEKPIADASVTETMSTAVSYDAESKVTVLHYVVPVDLAGNGVLHRVLFDANGAEIPGSHAVLDGTQRNRPSSVIAGGALYLGSSGPNGPTVERFSLLRTTQ